MKKSWSHKLFLYVNSLIGKKLWRDKLMYFFAVWLIWLLFVYVVFIHYVYVGNVSFPWFFAILYHLGISIVVGLLISYFFAYFIRHRRPFVEFPEMKTLMRMKTSWKSFPSDHSFVSFSLAFSLYFLVLPWYYTFFAVIIAGCVAIGRVYVGVHYPRDVIGGMIWALIVVAISNIVIFTHF